jgi:hypothetical protein
MGNPYGQQGMPGMPGAPSGTIATDPNAYPPGTTWVMSPHGLIPQLPAPAAPPPPALTAEALAAAIAAAQEQRPDPAGIAERSRALEVEEMGIAGGRQDHSAAAFGGALDGFAELRDPKAWKRVLACLAVGQPNFGRRAAVVALAKLAEPAEKKTEAVERIAQALRDENFRVRLAAIDAASTLNDERLIGPLSTTPFLDGREQRLAREAVRALRAKSATTKEVQSLRGELEKLKSEVRALSERLPAKR